MPSTIEQAAALLRSSAYTTALTGAGVSTPSGIPDFRSPEAGLWSQVDPLMVASIWAFHERPAAFYRWFRPLYRLCRAARPNAAHRVLAAMEVQGSLQTLITQNMDSLHQQAGNRHVLEVHGNCQTATCLGCGSRMAGPPLWEVLDEDSLPPRCESCGELVKPDVVLFGEPVSYEVLRDAQQEALRSEVMLVVGTSLEVMPAADLPPLARRRGARTILINRSPTAAEASFDVVIHADVEGALAALWQRMRI